MKGKKVTIVIEMEYTPDPDSYYRRTVGSMAKWLKLDIKGLIKDQSEGKFKRVKFSSKVEKIKVK